MNEKSSFKDEHNSIFEKFNGHNLDEVVSELIAHAKASSTGKPTIDKTSKTCQFCQSPRVLAINHCDLECVGPPIPEMEYAYSCGSTFDSRKKNDKQWEQGRGCKAILFINDRA